MYQKYIKRILDIVLSSLLIILFLPFFIITLFLVIIDKQDKIIFKQEREGKNNKPFIMYKFCIMNDDESMKRSDRMSSIGKFLDRYKFNELPQLFNILKGDMSIIGPRPFMTSQKLKGKVPKERYMVRPGLTGLAQVNGGRDMEFSKKVGYDVIYYKNLSFLLDLKILIKTPYSIIKYR